MTTKYWRLKLPGERSVDEIQSVIGRSSGNVVRIHIEGGETHVYFAAQKSAASEAAKAMKETAKLEEVSLSEVKKLS